MIKSIQFSQGVLSFAITLPRATASCESKRRVEFDFGEGGAVAELHRGELVNFLYSINAESPYKISDLIFELLGAEAGVRRVNFDLFYRASESLEGSTAPDVGVQLAGSAVERAGSEEDIPF
jgi:hypothetical protein